MQVTLMARGIAALLAAAVLLASAPPAAAAKDVVIGGAVGWGLGMQYPDVTAEVGDTLVFKYMSMHDVRPRIVVASFRCVTL